MYTKQVEDMLRKEVENMDINKLKELALKTLIIREKAKLRKRKFDKNKKMEKMERFSKNEI